VTPEQRVTAAIDCTPYAKATPDAYADAALDAVRDALTSEVARVFGIPPHMLMDTVLASRAWAVWDRKRRARRKR